MPWFVDKPKTVEASALVLLRGMNETAPGLGQIGLDLFAQGFNPAETGQRLGQQITEKVLQFQQEAVHLQMCIQQLRQKNDELAGVNQRLRDEPLRLRVKDLQREMQALSSRAGRAEALARQWEETTHRQAKLHTLEIGHLQSQVAELQRLVARQHMQLIELLGDNFTRLEGETSLEGKPSNG